MAIDISRIKPETLYSVKEAATALGVSGQTIRLYLNTGKLRGSKSTTDRWRIPGKEIIRFANK